MNNLCSLSKALEWGIAVKHHYIAYLYNSGIKNFLNLGTISAIFMNSFARLVEVTTTYAADF